MHLERFLEEFKANNLIPEEVLNQLVKEACDIARKLRDKGVKVPTHAVITLIKLIENYYVLTGELITTLKSGIGLKMLKAVFASNIAEENLIDAIIREAEGAYEVRDIIKRSVELLGGYGRRINPSRLSRLEEKRAYAILRMYGLVRRRKGREYIPSKAVVESSIKRIEKTRGSNLRDLILRDLRKGSLNTAFMLPQDLSEVIEELSVMEITKLISMSYSVGNKALARYLIDELSKRIKSFEELDRNSARKLYDIIVRERMLPLISDNLLTVLVRSEPSLLELILPKIDKAKAKRIMKLLVKNYPNTTILPKLVRNNAGLQVILDAIKQGELPPIVIGSASHLRIGDRDIEEIFQLARVEGLLLKAIISGNEGYVDYAEYELERIKDSNLDPNIMYRIKVLKDFITTRSIDSLSKLIRLYSSHSPTLVVSLLSKISKCSSRELQQQARRLAQRFIEIQVTKFRRKARIIMKRRIVYGRGERIALHEALRKLITFRNPLVSWKTTRRPQLVLVLDKSGSMQPYTAMALLAASAFLDGIRRIVIFDSKPIVIDIKGRRSKYKILDYILSLEFSGYTDVVNALASAVRGLKPGYLVLISDLRQTVRSNVSVTDMLSRLKTRGWRIYVVSPPTIGIELSKLKQIVDKAVIIEDERRIGECLIKLLKG